MWNIKVIVQQTPKLQSVINMQHIPDHYKNNGSRNSSQNSPIDTYFVHNKIQSFYNGQKIATYCTLLPNPCSFHTPVSQE